MRGARLIAGIVTMLWIGSVVLSPAAADDGTTPALDRLAEYQDSNRVFTNSASNYVTMNAAIWPIIGQVVRLSGAKGGWRGGTITSDWTSWTSDTCGCTQWGADASYTMLNGDSGGPVVQGSATTGSTNGIGIAATLNGHMAILLEALDGLAVTLKT